MVRSPLICKFTFFVVVCRDAQYFRPTGLFHRVACHLWFIVVKFLQSCLSSFDANFDEIRQLTADNEIVPSIVIRYYVDIQDKWHFVNKYISCELSQRSLTSRAYTAKPRDFRSNRGNVKLYRLARMRCRSLPGSITAVTVFPKTLIYRFFYHYEIELHLLLLRLDFYLQNPNL